MFWLTSAMSWVKGLISKIMSAHIHGKHVRSGTLKVRIQYDTIIVKSTYYVKTSFLIQDYILYM